MESNCASNTENYINSDDYQLVSYASKEEGVHPFPPVRCGRTEAVGFSEESSGVEQNQAVRSGRSFLYTKSYKGAVRAFFMETDETCLKCQNKGRIMRANGELSPCFDCLIAGRMDQHDKNPKDSGIKI